MAVLGGIYVIINKVNGYKYIGQSMDIKRREYQHFWGLRKGNGSSPHLQNAFNVYGEENFEFKWILSCVNVPKEYLTKMEQYFVDTMQPEYNICKLVANSTLGINLSELAKDKISKSLIGNKRNLGKHHTEETKQHLSNKLKNRVRSQEEIQHICEGIKNRKVPNRNWLGKNHTEESKQLMSEIKKEWWAKKKALGDPRNDSPTNTISTIGNDN